MYILTKKYKYEVFKRLLEAKESFEIACSKSGLSINQAKKYSKLI
jgi:hypothetical protein